jgi:hypothetical protein
MYLSEKIIPWAGRRERDGELAGGQRSGAQPRRGRARTRETREGWLVRELFLNRRAGDLSSDARVTYRPGFFLARVRIDGFLGATSIGRDGRKIKVRFFLSISNGSFDVPRFYTYGHHRSLFNS